MAFRIRKWLLASVLLSIFFSSGEAVAAPRLQETGRKTVIVIDPGHGGEKQGTIEGDSEEKVMTMATALAMYEELSLYDGVEVYLTRTEDVDLSLKKRAQFAQSVDADFLFSIHYNASENHEFFGAEAWVSNVSPYNGYGYQFGYEFLTEMRDLGLLIRGVKTRQGDDGDYYGILRNSVALGIPAAILEHCHVDEARDAVYCDSEEKWKAFGRMDATAAARYFGLKSEALGVDYSGYSLVEVSADANVPATLQDGTEPEFCRLEVLDADYEAGTLELSVSAADPDSALLYYSYSLDGGRTFGPREAWPGSDALTDRYDERFSLTLEILPDTAPEVIFRAYNKYDLYAESDTYRSAQIFRPEPTETPQAKVKLETVEPPAQEPSGPDGVLLFGLFLLLSILLWVLLLQYLLYRKRRRRRQSRKDAGDSQSQHR